MGSALRDVALIRAQLSGLRSTLSNLSAEITAEQSGLGAIELNADMLAIKLKNAAGDARPGDGRVRVFTYIMVETITVLLITDTGYIFMCNRAECLLYYIIIDGEDPPVN